MAYCRAIVNSALRKIGRLGGGREPRQADATDTLAALQGMYLSWVSQGTFGRLSEVVPNADMTAAENMRVLRDPAVIEVILPDLVPAYPSPVPYNRERITYGANYDNVDGNNRPPRDGSVVQMADSTTNNVETYIYDGTLRQWTRVERLQMDDQAPRSYNDPEGLAACLALEIADIFGADVGQTTQRQAMRFLTSLTHGYSLPREAAIGVYC